MLMDETLKLTMELVPASCWGNSLYQKYRHQWRKLRKEAAIRFDYKCSICEGDCSGKYQLIGHEVWDYDDRQHIQRLSDIVALCFLCDRVKHYGKSLDLASRGRIKIQEVQDHFLKVNDCDLETFQNHLSKAMRQWAERSGHEWTQELGEYEYLVETSAKVKAKTSDGPLERDPEPGDHMPNSCLICGAIGHIVLIEENADGLSEGELAEYLAGTAGYACCGKCGGRFRWQI